MATWVFSLRVKESFLEPPHALFSSWVGRKLRFPLLSAALEPAWEGWETPVDPPTGAEKGCPDEGCECPSGPGPSAVPRGEGRDEARLSLGARRKA